MRPIYLFLFAVIMVIASIVCGQVLSEELKWVPTLLFALSFIPAFASGALAGLNEFGK